MKNLKITLTPEQVEAKKKQLADNIQKLTGKEGLEAMVADFQKELDDLNALELKSVGIDKVAVFKELFGDMQFELDDKMKEFVGEGIVVKILPDGTLELVKKSGGNFGGTKKATPYIEFYLGGKSHKTASDCVEHALELLKANGVELKVSTGNSMRREIVKLNADHKLGVEVKDRATNERYALADSPHEKAVVESEETEEGEDGAE